MGVVGLLALVSKSIMSDKLVVLIDAWLDKGYETIAVLLFVSVVAASTARAGQFPMSLHDF